MGRFLAGMGATLLLVTAGLFRWKGSARTDASLPRPEMASKPLIVAALPAELPVADRNREQKRFGRYDDNQDGQVSREEYLSPRRKAWAKLDTNGDGKLSFEEWVHRTTDKFLAADQDRSNTLSAAEFAATRANRKAKPRCPEASARDDSDS